MQVLVIPDVHLKTWMFKTAEKVVKQEHPDAIVMLGDLVDDFGCKNSPDKYIETIDAAIEFYHRHPETYLCLGNHEASYLWDRETNATGDQCDRIPCPQHSKNAVRETGV